MGTFRSVTACRICDGPTRDVFGFEHAMPLAGAFTESADAARALPRYPLTWRYCLDCLLVQVEQDVPDSTLYTHYNYASSTIPALCAHFDEFAGMLRMVYGERQPFLIEIGCNDGVLLNRLPDEWVLMGFDPSDIARDAAPADAHYLLIDRPFPSDVVEGADVIVASNTLAHMSNIRGTLEAAYKALKPGGDLWIEVHDLDETLRTGQWDTIYHEHKVEWSTRSLYKACKRIGFERIFADRLPLHGGLLRQCFRKEQPWSTGARRIDQRPDDFSTLGLRYRERRITHLYVELWNEFAKIAYGAAGRASVWFNQLPDLPFQAVVDDSPQRIGKYVPGVGYPIVRWEERPDSNLCLITAWNYAREIEAAHPEYDGRWLRTFG